MSGDGSKNNRKRTARDDEEDFIEEPAHRPASSNRRNPSRKAKNTKEGYLNVESVAVRGDRRNAELSKEPAFRTGHFDDKTHFRQEVLGPKFTVKAVNCREEHLSLCNDTVRLPHECEYDLCGRGDETHRVSYRELMKILNPAKQEVGEVFISSRFYVKMILEGKPAYEWLQPSILDRFMYKKLGRLYTDCRTRESGACDDMIRNIVSDRNYMNDQVADADAEVAAANRLLADAAHHKRLAKKARKSPAQEQKDAREATESAREAVRSGRIVINHPNPNSGEAATPPRRQLPLCGNPGCTEARCVDGIVSCSSHSRIASLPQPTVRQEEPVDVAPAVHVRRNCNGGGLKPKNRHPTKRGEKRLKSAQQGVLLPKTDEEEASYKADKEAKEKAAALAKKQKEGMEDILGPPKWQTERYNAWLKKKSEEKTQEAVEAKKNPVLDFSFLSEEMEVDCPHYEELSMEVDLFSLLEPLTPMHETEN